MHEASTYKYSCLLFHNIQSHYSYKGATVDNYRICDLKWQQFEVVDADAEQTAPLALPSPDSGGAWTPEDNDRLTASLVSALAASGVLEAALAREAEADAEAAAAPAATKNSRKPAAKQTAAAPSLARQMKDRIAAALLPPPPQQQQGESSVSSAAPVAVLPPSLAQEFGSVEALVAALEAKAQGLPSPHLERERGEASEAAAKNEPEAAGSNQQPQQQQQGADVGTEELREAVATATFQRSEAVRVAERIKALALAQTAAAGPARKGGTSFVLRVLELAGERVETVLEALSFLDLEGASVVIEYFLACSNAALLPKLGTKLNRRSPNPNLRIRRVLFNDMVRVELKDLVFHALVLDDWVHTGAETWRRDEYDGNDKGLAPAPPTSSAAAMAFLSRFLVPNAHVYVRGLTELPLWAALASQVSPSPLPLAPTGAAAAQAEWEATLAAYGDGPAGLIEVNAATPVLTGRFSRAAWEKMAVVAGWVIAVAPSTEVG